MSYRLEMMPEGYSLQAYDDCGTLKRQSRVKQRHLGVVSPDAAEADPADRLYTWDRNQIDIEYDDLDPRWGYAVALKFVGEKHRERLQSVWAAKHQILPPHQIHAGWTERLILRIPGEVIEEGKLREAVKNEGGHSVMVSGIELWSNGEPSEILRFIKLLALYRDLRGVVSDIRFRPVGGATVSMLAEGSDTALATAVSGRDGTFRFDRKRVEEAMGKSRETEGEESVVLTAEREGYTGWKKLGREDLVFEPVHYRPLPVRENDLQSQEISLGGKWYIDPAPDTDSRKKPLKAQNWKEFNIPGQWVQQGFDVPQDEPVALSREFAVPEEWKGQYDICTV